MPTTSGRSRTWSVVVALVAVVLALTICGAPASARPHASGAPVVSAGGADHVDATRTPELRPTTSPHATPQHLGLTAQAPRVAHPPVSRPATPAAYRLTPPTPVGDAAPRGRAPPAA